MNNDRILQTILMLKSRTVENGFSELEEKISIDKSNKLIKDYQIDTTLVDDLMKKLQAAKKVEEQKIKKSILEQITNVVSNLSIISFVLVPYFIWYSVAINWTLAFAGIGALPILLFLPIFACNLYQNKYVPLAIAFMGTVMHLIS